MVFAIGTRKEENDDLQIAGVNILHQIVQCLLFVSMQDISKFIVKGVQLVHQFFEDLLEVSLTGDIQMRLADVEKPAQQRLVFQKCFGYFFVVFRQYLEGDEGVVAFLGVLSLVSVLGPENQVKQFLNH